MRHECLKGSPRRKAYRVLERWMRETATLLQGFHYHSPEYRPFEHLEVPGVSLLVGSAAAAGYYPIAEYDLEKIDRKDRRRKRSGRADLWFVAGENSYSFEFKRVRDRYTSIQVRNCLDAATADASDIPDAESDYAFGAVIAPVLERSQVAGYESFREADYVFVVNSQSEAYLPIFFYFRQSR